MTVNILVGTAGIASLFCGFTKVLQFRQFENFVEECKNKAERFFAPCWISWICAKNRCALFLHSGSGFIFALRIYETFPICRISALPFREECRFFFL